MGAAPTTEFAKLLRGEADVDLIGLLLEFARDAEPDLDAGWVRAELAALGEAARAQIERLPPDASDVERLRTLNRLFFDDFGFRGNANDYYDPRNSYLNQVVGRRTGMPISLAIVYQTLAVRSGLNVYGVGTPGHFMIGFRDAAEACWYVDPFQPGPVLTTAECLEFFTRKLGPGIHLSDEHLRPATLPEIAVRVLRNLKTCHAARDDWRAALPVQHRLALLLPTDSECGRDLGLMYLRLGEPRKAMTFLEEAAAADPALRDDLTAYVRAARRMIAELN